MKKLLCIVIAVWISVLMAAAARAQQDYEKIGTQGGVEVMVRYNPFGYNNLIVAFIKFVNTNDYKVDVDWTPLINCEGLPVKKGYGAPFSMNENGSYEVTMWRSEVCGQVPLKGIQVKMYVKKEGF
ncbi:MAG: hypothetical protein P8013_06160 [Candidatus Sulfobium sp.]|jgi:hypothetical protein